MFKILQKTLKTGIVTRPYPAHPARPSEHFRGRPEFDFNAWRNAGPAADACPTGAIHIGERDGSRQVSVDYGRCIFCGQCAAVSGGKGVRMTREFELAATDRSALIVSSKSPMQAGAVGEKLDHTVRRVLGRSLAIRQVDAGSCNGCELEIVALNNPVHDIERFGIHFVASPRHADMLLVTGPVTRNMELALRKTYDATPEPKVVVAAGACGISGGIFGVNYATRGGVDQVIPVDVYVPGCPPRPEALLHGILLAVGRLKP
ncbi:MAG: NADH-quinone oxidoreductase subunit NuoB [Bryobacteraceae bacterium]